MLLIVDIILSSEHNCLHILMWVFMKAIFFITTESWYWTIYQKSSKIVEWRTREESARITKTKEEYLKKIGNTRWTINVRKELTQESQRQRRYTWSK